MAKIIAFREDGWMPPNTDYRQWNALARAFGHELQMIDSWSEAVIPDNHKIVLADEDGTFNLLNYTHPVDAVYVFGRSNQNLITIVPYDEAVKIPTLHGISLFGISASSIIIGHRHSQLMT